MLVNVIQLAMTENLIVLLESDEKKNVDIVVFIFYLIRFFFIKPHECRPI